MRKLALLAAIVLLGACNDDGRTLAPIDPTDAPPSAPTLDTSTTRPGPDTPANLVVDTSRPAPATVDPLLVWALEPGECQDCAFTMTVFADGTVLWVTPGQVGFAAEPLDSAVRDAAAEATVENLTTDTTTDCGREVDGAAPVLTVYAADGPVGVDTCYAFLDSRNPVVGALAGFEDAVRGAAEDVVVSAEFPLTGSCDAPSRAECALTTAKISNNGLVIETETRMRVGGIPVRAWILDPSVAADVTSLVGAGNLDCVFEAVEPTPNQTVYRAKDPDVGSCWIRPGTPVATILDAVFLRAR